MLEKLFTRPWVLKRYVEAPLLGERDRYLAHCSETGTARFSLALAANFQLTVMNYLKLSGERPVTPEEINAAAELWASRQPLEDAQSSRRQFRHQATEWLKFLGWLKTSAPPVHPYAQVISQFSGFMRDDKGLAPATIELGASKSATSWGIFGIDVSVWKICQLGISIRLLHPDLTRTDGPEEPSRRTWRFYADSLNTESSTACALQAWLLR